MDPSIHFALLLPLAVLLLIALGAAMLRRGWLPRRVGDEPHCQPCGYLLVGLQSERCPECGVLLSPANILHGQRHRRPGMALAGAAILLLGLAILALFVGQFFAEIPWYHYKPTFLVMRDLRAGGGNAGTAMAELDRREQAGELSSKYQQQLIEMGLAQQATTASGGLTQAMIEFVEQQYIAGHLTDAQKKRFGEQSVPLSLRVRPIVVLGNRVPYEVDHSSRVCGPDFYVRIIDNGGEINIDGKKIRDVGGGEGSVSGLGSSGSSSNSVQCTSPGKHQLSITTRIELRHGNFGTGSLVYQENRTLTGDFEIVAQPPTGDFKLINDPTLTSQIQASIVPAGFHLGPQARPRLEGEVKITAMPADIAFDVFARIDGREYSLNTLTAKKGGGVESYMGTTITGPAATRPATFDLILRSSEKAARETIDQHEIWSGELIYPNVPIAPQKP